ncbi:MULTISPECIES: hypothetical protein [Pseudomonas]|jgi:hypothetical protein|uniref:hypothetical protein n=1 Tax=Pseudomonas TaxID=286 RepID=UPI0003DCC57B|nr:MULTISPECIES: hypothetical protein [Pseudomonas]ETK20469.1 hypothetical protein H096_21298 [Pseudomonas sp. FH1]
MQQSSSRFIELESVALKELFKRESGAIGIYLPARGEDGKVQKSLASIASQAKALACKMKKRCVLQTLLAIENSVEGDVPAPVRMLKVTVTPEGEYTPRGERYIAANLS